MGISVLVTLILNEIEVKDAILMISLGIIALSIYLFKSENFK